MKAIATALVLLGAIGCGDDGPNVVLDSSEAIDGVRSMDMASSDALASGTFSCDTTLAGYHICFDFSWSGTSDFGAREMQSCTGSLGGKLVASCTHANSNGGCKRVMMTEGNTVVLVAWYYDITVQLIQSTCASAMATFVDP